MSDQVVRSRYAETDSQRYLWHLQQLRRKKRARRREPDIVFAQVLSTTGDPIIHEDVDGDGLWDAYEFQASGSIELTAGLVGRRLWQGGGANGGANNAGRGGGGGGGGWTAEDDGGVITSGTYTITIGAGAPRGEGRNDTAADGSSTEAFSVTAPGGGRGGAGDSYEPNGGGNGGGGRGSLTGDRFAGIGDPGNDGGDGDRSTGGGGGGSGSSGQNATEGQGGNGGAGINSDILGTVENFGAGGGGSNRTDASDQPGSAGGDSATDAVLSASSSDAPVGRGGGSGGVSSASAEDVFGAGGSGCFIIRIRRAA